jgi:hypothetical protein
MIDWSAKLAMGTLIENADEAGSGARLLERNVARALINEWHQ